MVSSVYGSFRDLVSIDQSTVFYCLETPTKVFLFPKVVHTQTALMALDLHAAPADIHYFVTVSTKHDLSAEQVAGLVTWHKLRPTCLLVKEFRSDGVAHFHSVFKSSVKRANTVTRNLTRLFATLEIQVVIGVTIVVKKVTDLIGIWHYVLKDLEPDSKPLVIRGWRLTWIREQLLSNLKKIPHKVLIKDDAFVEMRSSVGLVIEYSKRKGIPIAGKVGFRTCLCAMAEEGYRFEKVKIKQLYIHVLAQLHDTRPFASFIDSELMFLD